ncbi:MAG: cyclic 2,3-diphosphoglycerate synthase [archaeon]|nr:cyclic 2,3-diphosphoglycerate synthase [archaeon]
MPKKLNALIMGAAGRDFHLFNTFFRKNPYYAIKCFTAAQIPGIAGRSYPKQMAGKFYKTNIPIFPEEQLAELIKKYKIERVFFAYSDVSYEYIMHKSALVNSLGANFSLISPQYQMIKSKKKVVSVCAVRTGSGKSQVSRLISKILRESGKKVAVIRHPMPYGDLLKEAVQRFGSYEDLEKHNVTLEEREEYESHIKNGVTVFAGVDYEKILRKAEKEADVIIWDGGNNDAPFYKPDLHIVIADPFRVGHESSYYPSETNVLMADALIINKVNTAPKENVAQLKQNLKKLNSNAEIIEANSAIFLEGNSNLAGKKVLVVEDGPTLTHGGMNIGAGFIAAQKAGAEIIDPRPYAVGSIKAVFEKFTQLKEVLPAMGYSEQQLKELEQTINAVPCDLVLSGTPIDLGKLVKTRKPIQRVSYELEEISGQTTIKSLLQKYKIIK